MDRRVEAQQVAVAIPPITATVLMAGWEKGELRLANLGTLDEAQVLAEKAHALDRIDDRDEVEGTIAAGAAVGATATKSIEVPTGEVWFLNRLVLVSPAESGVGVGDIVQVNVRVSKWTVPDVRGGTTVDANGRAYWPAAQGTAALNTYTIDLPAQGELGEELRLEGGDKLTLTAVLTGVAAGADLTASLTPYGRKGKKLV